ncbi:hypothetical protein [Mycoplasma nasistruthionis]|uniref:Uncharacterized protein n=1 Tax=Mycoplasma nasistruthionis TaxID=353852 RepID=A0A5B7XWP1_9MOLU|nr:hypothetical protein [Mycoplasma nasistruthionis]QCZ36954.1 hypothetical protein FG904_03015 [Mycoplasma nasistruthionis]
MWCKKEETKTKSIEKDKTSTVSKPTPSPKPAPVTTPKTTPKTEKPVVKTSEGGTPTNPKPNTTPTPPVDNNTPVAMPAPAPVTKPSPVPPTDNNMPAPAVDVTPKPKKETENPKTSEETKPKSTESANQTPPTTSSETTPPTNVKPNPVNSIPAEDTELTTARNELKKLLEAKNSELNNYSDTKYQEIKTTLETAYSTADAKKESTSKDDLKSAKTTLEQSIEKAKADKTKKDIELAKNALKALLDKKDEKLAEFNDPADSKYTLNAVKKTLEDAYATAKAVYDKQNATAAELTNANHPLENAILEANTAKLELTNLYNETRNSLLSRFNKMFEYKRFQGINDVLFDKYNEAAVAFYNEGNKLDKTKLTEVKTKITEALAQAEETKKTALELTTSAEKTRIINFSQMNASRQNNSADNTIDGNINLSIPFFGGTDGRGAVGKDAEIKYHFSKPTNIKSVRLHQYITSGHTEVLWKISVYGQEPNGNWVSLGTITAENQDDATLKASENKKVELSTENQAKKFKTITIKSYDTTKKWWGIRDVEIKDTNDKRVFIETPVVVSTIDYPTDYLYEEVLKYKDEAPAGKEYKVENLFDNSDETFNTYRHHNKDKNIVYNNDKLYMDFMKPINIHSIKVKQDALLKLKDMKIILTTNDDKKVEHTFNSVEKDVNYNLSSDDAKKTYKRIEIVSASDSTGFWQLNEVEIL